MQLSDLKKSLLDKSLPELLQLHKDIRKERRKPPAQQARRKPKARASGMTMEQLNEVIAKIKLGNLEEE